MFGSRSFSSRVLSDALSSDQLQLIGETRRENEMLHKLFSDHFAVLLPLVDIANHRPMAQVEWQAHSDFVGLAVLETYESGQEIYNNYGPRDNEGLLLAYGFTLENNPFDHFAVKIRAPPNSPVADARTWTRDPRSEMDDQYYIFNVNHPRSKDASALETSVFSYDLLDTISILTANDYELETMYERQQTLMSYSLGMENGFEDSRNVLSTLCQLMRECEARAARLHATNPLNAPASRKQKYAQIYRESQISILETAGCICKFSLLRACTGLNQAEILELLLLHQHQADNKSPSLENLTTLLHRSNRHLIKQAKELYTDSELLNLLPQSISSDLTNLIIKVEEQVNPEETDSETNSSKARFVIILAYLWKNIIQHPTPDSTIPHQLKSSIHRLSQIYPYDQYSEAYDDQDPSSELASLLTTAILKVTKALDRESITWACTIVEEQTIRLSKEVVDLLAPNEGSSSVLRSSDLFIYLKSDIRNYSKHRKQNLIYTQLENREEINSCILPP